MNLPRRSDVISSPRNRAPSFYLVIIFLVFSVILSACRKEPEAIAFGADSCEHCKMTISDRRFGGEIVTKKGKVHKFDSLECLTSYQHAHSPEASEEAKIFVLHGSGNAELILAATAKFQESPTLHAPMGRAFLATGENETPLVPLSTQVMTWEEVKKSIEQKKPKP